MAGNTQQPDTQPETQSQNQSNFWPSSYLESQPIEDVVWGRLYAKNIRFASLGIKQTNLCIEKSQTQYGIWIMFFFLLFGVASFFFFFLNKQISDKNIFC